MGVFYLLCSWGVLVGWGTDRVNQFINSGENPVFALARSLWSGAWIIVLLAVINSALAISLAAANATTRVAFALGSGGVLPKFLGHVHPRYRTPSSAILLLTAISLSSGLILGFWGLGPTNELFFFGVVITLLAIIIYSMGNIGVFLYYRRDRRAEFNPWLHFIFPLLSTISLLWVGYKSVNPLPAPPVKYAPFVVAGWALFASIVTFVMSRTGEEGGSASRAKSLRRSLPIPSSRLVLQWNSVLMCLSGRGRARRMRREVRPARLAVVRARRARVRL